MRTVYYVILTEVFARNRFAEKTTYRFFKTQYVHRAISNAKSKATKDEILLPSSYRPISEIGSNRKGIINIVHSGENVIEKKKPVNHARRCVLWHTDLDALYMRFYHSVIRPTTKFTAGNLIQIEFSGFGRF